jgi:hypothetical protein
MGEEFMREMFKPVDANIGGKPVRTPQHVLFIQQPIKAGITGGGAAVHGAARVPRDDFLCCAERALPAPSAVFG